jgi:DNA invertase Pin-like site-specific DNA recombinase
VSERSGWKVIKVYEDAGISGAKGRDQRSGLDAMMKAVNAKEFDMVGGSARSIAHRSAQHTPELP